MKNASAPGVVALHLVVLGHAVDDAEHRRIAHVPDPLEDLPPVEVRQADVEDHDVGTSLEEPSGPLATGGRFAHGVALIVEEHPQRVAYDRPRS